MLFLSLAILAPAMGTVLNIYGHSGCTMLLSSLDSLVQETNGICETSLRGAVAFEFANLAFGYVGMFVQILRL